MAIDFKKKLLTKDIERKTDPIELYDTLDRKSVAGPLRPAQTVVLKEWYLARKDERDLIIKLHTGEGKTLVGLLILQSLINSKEGPCLYVCPNNYLVSQVCAEADKFGISYCLFDKQQMPNEFIAGNKILITTAQKVFNGKSVFGIDNQYIKVGAILLDDSHSCIDTVKKAFTISITKKQNEELYKKIFTLFEDDLANQGEGSLFDIKSGDYDTLMAVPYWSLDSKNTELLNILGENQRDASILYVWPLIRNNIKNYCCYISGTKIEFSPYNINIDTFKSFSHAKRRILMSATTQDDSFFIKGLGFLPTAIEKPLINADQKWSGEKMLIIPSLIDDSCDRNSVISNCVSMSHENFGIIAIVPSTKYCYQYQQQGATIVTTENISDELKKIRQGNFTNILVINNRYDGIDLPDESCRLLIMDGMPYFDNLADRYEALVRAGSETINKEIAQKIEQGIGRGVRGEKDYCAILIIGNDLVRFMRSIATNKYFSPQTQKQIDIGIEIANTAKADLDSSSNPMEFVRSIFRQLLDRDEGWKEYYLSEMNTLGDDCIEISGYERLLSEREIESLFSKGEIERACKLMQNLVDRIDDDDVEKGWYLQQLARYTYPIDPLKAIQIQKNAYTRNCELFKPQCGIEYTKISYIHENRLNNIRKYLLKFNNYNELLLNINALLDDLSFGVESKKFELALKEIGLLLGYVSQCPDRENKKGPDNLWCGVNDHYLLFGCKNEVSEDRKAITKQEAGQMNNHCGWFENQYGVSKKVDRFIIIPTKNLAYDGDFTHLVKVIRRQKLREFKQTIRRFIQEIKQYDFADISDEKLQSILDYNKLNVDDFSFNFSEDFYHLPQKNVTGKQV